MRFTILKRETFPKWPGVDPTQMNSSLTKGILTAMKMKTIINTSTSKVSTKMTGFNKTP